jgi:uncharacterized phage-associated protein
MRFAFNEEKAAEAASLLIMRHGGKINSGVLLKLLYLADREALMDTGQPITGDQMVSMPWGPVLSGVLDRIREKDPAATSPWIVSISPRMGHDVTLVSDPGVRNLSEYEIGVLEDIDDRYGRMPWPDLMKFTHGLPEYRDPGMSSRSIPPEEVLRVGGKSDEEINQMTEEAEELWFLDTLKGS